MPENDNDMQRMQQDAIRRVREMQSRARNLQQAPGGSAEQHGGNSPAHTGAGSGSQQDRSPHPNVTSYGIGGRPQGGRPQTNGQQRSQPESSPQDRSAPEETHAPLQEEPTTGEKVASALAGGNLTDIFDALFKEGDRAIILILLLLLIEDGDTSLVFALMYLIL